MTDAQRRHLAVSVRYIDQLLEEAGRAAPRLPEAPRDRIAAAVNGVRGELRRFAGQFTLDFVEPEVDPFHAVRVQLSVASISVAEMRSRVMRGYGELDVHAAAELDAACDALDAAVHRAQHAIDGA